MKVARKSKAGFVREVNIRKAQPAIASRAARKFGISKLALKTSVAGKRPLHLSRIIHIGPLH
jgi:hypothetical protein